MKNFNKWFILVLGISIISVISSCHKDEYNEKINIRSSNFTHSFFDTDTMFKKLYLNLTETYGPNFVDSLNFMDSSEAEIIFKDLIEIGTIYLDTSLDVNLNEFIQNNNISAFELASLGIHLYVLQNYGDELLNRGDWVDCLSAAVGLTTIKELSTAGMSAALSTGSAIKILKSVGKRYLGWIGVALMVNDFVDCMS